MKQKKPVSILLPVIYWFCAAMWSFNVAKHIVNGTFDLASQRVLADVFCTIIWICLAVVWTMRYKRSK